MQRVETFSPPTQGLGRAALSERPVGGSGKDKPHGHGVAETFGLGWDGCMSDGSMLDSTTGESPTIRQIAKQAGVSASTVSRVLRGRGGVGEELRRRVFRAIETLGATPEQVRLSASNRLERFARGNLPGTGPLLALILHDVSSPFYVEVLRGVEAEAYQRGYGLVLYTTADRPEEDLVNRVLLRNHCQGLVVITPRQIATIAKVRQSAAPPLPVVVVDYRGDGSPFPHVAVNNLKGAFEATRYLLQKGYRRIGFVTGVLTIQSAVDRLRGYRLALEEAGVRYDPSFVVEGDFQRQGGYQAVRGWAQSGKPMPDAWFCSNDMMAFGALQALHELGYSVPSDVAVMGFDDIPMASSSTPPLTTVAQPMEEMGVLAVRMVTDIIERGEVAISRVLLETRLIVRQSA